jgi:hypothetical protein
MTLSAVYLFMRFGNVFVDVACGEILNFLGVFAKSQQKIKSNQKVNSR